MRYECVQLPVPGGEIELKVYAADVPPGDDAPGLRTAVVICGGGGYSHISARETEPIALRLVAYGINACTVAYRHDPEAHWPVPVQDVGAAVAWMRSHAPEHHTDPGRIAVMGFSAGGHAAACVGTCWQDAALWAPVGLTPEQVRPNAMVLGYPVITGGAFAHRGSFVNLTGSEDLAVHARYSLDEHVTAATPPTFLWHTWEDQSVPVENTLLFASALHRCGVQGEVHIYPHGCHGAGLCDETTDLDGRHLVPEAVNWPQDAARFLRDVL